MHLDQSGLLYDLPVFVTRHSELLLAGGKMVHGISPRGYGYQDHQRNSDFRLCREVNQERKLPQTLTFTQNKNS